MTTVLTAGAAFLAILVAAYTVVQAWLRWRAYRTTELRRIATAMRTILTETLLGRRLSEEYVSERGQALHIDLGDLRDQLHDRTLRCRIDRVLKYWRLARDIAVTDPTPHPEPWPDLQPEPWPMTTRIREVERWALQSAVAWRAADEVHLILDRCNRLTRFIVGSID